MAASEPNELLDLDLSRVRPERRNGHSNTFRPRHSGALSVGPNVPPPGPGRSLAAGALTAPTPGTKDRLPPSRAPKSAGWGKTKRAVDASAAANPPVVVAPKLPPPNSSELPSPSLTSLGRSRSAKVAVQKDNQRGSFSPKSSGLAVQGEPAKERAENIDSLFGPEDPSPPDNFGRFHTMDACVKFPFTSFVCFFLNYYFTLVFRWWDGAGVLGDSAAGPVTSGTFAASSSRMSRWFVQNDNEDSEANSGGPSSIRPDEDLGGLGNDLMAQLDFAARGGCGSDEEGEEILLEQPSDRAQGKGSVQVNCTFIKAARRIRSSLGEYLYASTWS